MAFYVHVRLMEVLSVPFSSASIDCICLKNLHKTPDSTPCPQNLLVCWESLSGRSAKFSNCCRAKLSQEE